MAAEIFAGLGAFKTMMDLAKALKDMDTAAARNAAVIELQEKIFAAQTAQTSLIASIGELEEKVRSFEAWEREKKRYQLQRLHDGSFAYALKTSMSDGEPAHYICATCYQDDKKMILQGATWHLGEHSLTCPRCNTKVVHSWREGSHNDSYVVEDYDPLDRS